MNNVIKCLQLDKDELQVKESNWILVIEVITCTVLLALLCFNNNIWWDEAYTYDIVVNNDISNMIMMTAIDVHPPLYYLMVKVVSLLGVALWKLKFLSVAACVCSMLLIATKVQKRFGIKTAIILIFVVAFGPQMSVFNVQLRMYSWAAFFSLASAIYAYEIVVESSKKNWILFVFYSVCGAYTLYFAAIVISYIYGFLLLYFLIYEKKKVKAWLGLCFITICLYSPWLYIFFTCQVPTFAYNTPNNEFIKEGLFKEFVLWSFENYFVGDIVVYMGILLGALFALYRFKALEQKNRFFVLVLLSSPLWTWLLGAVFTFMADRSLLHRYMFPSLIVFWMGIAIAIGKYKNRVFYIIMLLLCVLGFKNYVFTYHDEYHVAPYINETEAFITDNMKKDDIVVFELEPYRIMYQYYMPEQKLIYYEDMNLEQNVGKQFWYIDAWGGYFSSEEVDTYNIQKEECGEFGIQSMDFKIYKITVNGNE